MATYKILSTGNTIIADESFVEAMHPGDYELMPEAAPVVPRITRLTKLDYMNRFTDAELEQLYTLESSVPAVKVWLAKFNATTPDPDGTSIDLTDPRTIAGVQALETAGIIQAGRANEILSTTAV